MKKLHTLLVMVLITIGANAQVRLDMPVDLKLVSERVPIKKVEQVKLENPDISNTLKNAQG